MKLQIKQNEYIDINVGENGILVEFGMIHYSNVFDYMVRTVGSMKSENLKEVFYLMGYDFSKEQAKDIQEYMKKKNAYMRIQSLEPKEFEFMFIPFSTHKHGVIYNNVYDLVENIIKENLNNKNSL